MKELTFDGVRCRRDTEGFWLSLHMPSETAARQFAYQFPQGKLHTAVIGRKRKARSLDANAYLWVLCQKIAEAVGSTKEAVYRACVRRKGQFTVLSVTDTAVNDFISRWGAKGTGWIAELLDDSKTQGHKDIIAYYGSSTYDTGEMSALLDEVVSEANILDIPTETPEEIALMKSRWEGVR